jgi:hypothetical protein
VGKPLARQTYNTMIKIALSFICSLGFIFAGLVSDTETRQLGEFDALRLSGAFEVNLVKADQPAIKIEARGDDELADITTSVRNRTLRVENERRNYSSSRKTILTIYYTALSEIEARGAYRIRTEQALVGESLRVDLHGAGNTELDLDQQRLVVEMSGAGNTDLTGKARWQDVRMSGAGSYRALDLVCDSARIHLNGVGTVEVTANKSLDAEANGIGTVRYRGKPERLRVQSMLLGSIRPVDR